MDPNPPVQSVTPKQQVVERVRAAANVLVTVRSNPSVDELAAAIGLTLMLNKLGKHATAVFSGQVPSTLEFLKPEETIEQNTDSLRDFIVSLDKSKADKLRYKVEENVVKIFITPYRTSITEKDLEFTQGDFNVDVVLALGVTQREELDQAITAHGRILHDATVITVVAGQKESTLGAINWQEPAASSLSEMLVSISEAFQGGLIDAQMATAFLTGIVAETERFSNPKTSPKVMTMAAQLMAAGANQQLIANELDKAVEVDIHTPVAAANKDIAIGDDGSLSIPHSPVDEAAAQPVAELPSIDDLFDEAAGKQVEKADTPSEDFLSSLAAGEPGGESFNPLVPDNVGVTQAPAGLPELPTDSTPLGVLPPPPPPEPPINDDAQIHIDDHGNMQRKSEAPKHKVIEPLQSEEGQGSVTEPEADLNAAAQALTGDTIVDPLTAADPSQDSSDRQKVHSVAPTPNFVAPDTSLPPLPELPPDSAPATLPDDTTLSEIEKSVESPHLQSGADPLQAAQDAVQQAFSQAPPDPDRLGARADVGAQTGPQIHRSLLPVDDHSQLPGLPSDDQLPVDPLNPGATAMSSDSSAGFDPTAPLPHQDDQNPGSQVPPPPPVPPPLSFPQQ